MRTIVRFDDHKYVTAEYHGGAYIDLTFGPATGATEVINVYDYATGAPEPAFQGNLADRIERERVRAAVRIAVIEWAQTNEDEGWTDWYEGYLENAGLVL